MYVYTCNLKYKAAGLAGPTPLRFVYILHIGCIYVCIHVQKNDCITCCEILQNAIESCPLPEATRMPVPTRYGANNETLGEAATRV